MKLFQGFAGILKSNLSEQTDKDSNLGDTT